MNQSPTQFEHHNSYIDTENDVTWLSHFLSIYQALNKDTLHLLSEVYHRDVVFIDPIHQIEGVDHLTEYFGHLYSNLLSCSFVITEVIEQDASAAIYWDMIYQHPKLRAGKPVVVQGHSLLKATEGKVIYHRDYLDVGAMLYEHIPLIGSIIKSIKKRATQ